MNYINKTYSVENISSIKLAKNLVHGILLLLQKLKKIFLTLKKILIVLNL